MNELLRDEDGVLQGKVNINDYGKITLDMIDENCTLPGYKLLDYIINNEDEIVYIKIMNENTVEDGYLLETDNNKYFHSSNTIIYNHASTINVLVVDDSEGISNRKFIEMPSISYISLGHELIHAYRDIIGQTDSGTTTYQGIAPKGKSKKGINKEEFQTVGLIAWNNPSRSITENDLRRQLGLPVRGWY